MDRDSFEKQLVNSKNKIVQARSRKFNYVPKEGFVTGAILQNYGRKYHNVGDDKVARWKRISGEIKNR